MAMRMHCSIPVMKGSDPGRVKASGHAARAA